MTLNVVLGEDPELHLAAAILVHSGALIGSFGPTRIRAHSRFRSTIAKMPPAYSPNLVPILAHGVN